MLGILKSNFEPQKLRKLRQISKLIKEFIFYVMTPFGEGTQKHSKSKVLNC